MNINGIAFIVNLEHGLLLDFDSIMGSFGAVLEKGCNVPIGDIQPLTLFKMAESADRILAEQRMSEEPCANEDGIQRLPKKVSSVLANEANTVTRTFSHAFADQFEAWMTQHTSDQERNRFIQGLLANMKTTHPCLCHCIVPDPANTGRSA